MTVLKYSVHDQNCPSRKVLEIISDKWTILIIEILSVRTFRFGELKKNLGGISQKMLAQTLRKLEQCGLIARKSYPVLPLKVEYSLTPLGKNLAAMLKQVTDWAEQNVSEILEAQNQYKEGA
jgi:DNA-binding HxlR family transcriptional regulator